MSRTIRVDLTQTEIDCVLSALREYRDELKGREEANVYGGNEDMQKYNGIEHDRVLRLIDRLERR